VTKSSQMGCKLAVPREWPVDRQMLVWVIRAESAGGPSDNPCVSIDRVMSGCEGKQGPQGSCREFVEHCCVQPQQQPQPWHLCRHHFK
jgi:hypothetical protein